MATQPDWLSAMLDPNFKPYTGAGPGSNQGGGALPPGAYFDPATNRYYAPTYSGGSNAETGGTPYAPTLVGYTGMDNSQDYAGNTNYTYDKDGNPTGTFQTGANKADFGEKLTLGMLAAMAGVAGAGMFGVGPAGAASGAGGASAGGASAGAGLFNPAVDSQLANSALGSSASAGYAGTGGVLGSPMTAGGAGAAGVGSAAGAGGGSSGLLSTIKGALPSGVGGLLGPAATLLGGLAGSKGKDASTTQTTQINPALMPYLQNGQGTGVWDYAKHLLDQQMSPEYQQQAAQLRNTGANLLSTPQMGNAYSSFYRK